MSTCKLIDINDKSFNGTTFITVTDNPKEDQRTAAGDCVRPTIIYLPKKTVKPPVNVILWLHGFFVTDFRKNIFGPDDGPSHGNNKLRESVDNSGKDVDSSHRGAITRITPRVFSRWAT